MSERILVGTRKGTFLAEKKNGSWGLRLSGHAGVGVNFAARDPNTGHLWASLGHGHWGAKLSRSTDDGATWADSAQVKYPAGARYLAPPDPIEEPAEGPTRYTLRKATLLKLWVLAFGSNGRIYVGTIPGGIFTSSDGGASFELDRGLWDHSSRGGDVSQTEGLGKTNWMGTPASEGGEFAPGISSIEVNPKDPNHVLIGVSTAGVLETKDGGKTWQGRNHGLVNDYLPDPNAEWGHDVHAVSLCAGDPRHVWQQNHCGVFYSSDGAATWKKVSAPTTGVHFGFPIVADEDDGKGAWVVPGRSDMERMAIGGGLFVGRTTDAGASWEALRRGLPQDNAYDVIYRHALAKSGNLVAFGSTTGNLYVSENRGDDWRALGNNLPPIYSVRFG